METVQRPGIRWDWFMGLFGRNWARLGRRARRFRGWTLPWTVSPPAVRADGATLYVDRWTQRVVSAERHEDGSIDEVLSGVGRGALLGDYSVVTQAHLAVRLVDRDHGWLDFTATGSSVATSTNGEELRSEFLGHYRVPVDAALVPRPEAQPFSLNWKIQGGTGRLSGAVGQGRFRGHGFPDGTFNGATRGLIWLNPRPVA